MSNHQKIVEVGSEGQMDTTRDLEDETIASMDVSRRMVSVEVATSRASMNSNWNVSTGVRNSSLRCAKTSTSHLPVYFLAHVLKLKVSTTSMKSLSAVWMIRKQFSSSARLASPATSQLSWLTRDSSSPRLFNLHLGLLQWQVTTSLELPKRDQVIESKLKLSKQLTSLF